MNIFTDIQYIDSNGRVTTLVKYPDYLVMTPTEALWVIADKISEEYFFANGFNVDALFFFLRHRSSFFVISLAREIENRITIPDEVKTRFLGIVNEFNNESYFSVSALMGIYKEALTRPLRQIGEWKFSDEEFLLEMAKALKEVPAYAIRKMVDDLPSSTYRTFIDQISIKAKSTDYRKQGIDSAEFTANHIFVVTVSDFGNYLDNQKILAEQVARTPVFFNKVAELFDLFFYTAGTLDLPENERFRSELKLASQVVENIRICLTGTEKDKEKMTNFEPKVAATTPKKQTEKEPEVVKVVAPEPVKTARLAIELLTDRETFSTEYTAAMAAIKFLFAFRDNKPNTAEALSAVIKVINGDSASDKVYLCKTFANNRDILLQEERQVAYSVLQPWLLMVEDKETKLILSDFIDKEIFG